MIDKVIFKQVLNYLGKILLGIYLSTGFVPVIIMFLLFGTLPKNQITFQMIVFIFGCGIMTIGIGLAVIKDKKRYLKEDTFEKKIYNFMFIRIFRMTKQETVKQFFWQGIVIIITGIILVLIAIFYFIFRTPIYPHPYLA